MKKIRSPVRKLIGKPIKLYMLIVVVFLIIVFLFYSHWEPVFYHSKSGDLGKIMFATFDKLKPSILENMSFPGARIVHLDLKGAPPKVAYYKKLFPLLSKMGATGILIEYEDMFPYSGPILRNISAMNAYSLKDIGDINVLAKENNLNVIPLVQTFGHLEFILKLEEFREYREVPEYPTVICPTHEKTLRLLEEMINQVIENHPNSNIIHIGADEVYNLGVCDRCVNAMAKSNLSKNMLFIKHINSVVDIIHRKHPHLQILMWDDEFRSFRLDELKGARLNNIVQPVVWQYSKDVYEILGPTLWDMYSVVFPKVWVASVFKGAAGADQFLPDVMRYVENHRSWSILVSEYKDRINFQGVIITGWQRYDHFAVLCELLPVGLPSLAMSLRVVLGYKDSPLSPPKDVAKLLGCEQPYALIGPVFGNPRCSYPGGDILEYVFILDRIKRDYEEFLYDSRIKGWMNRYNIDNIFSSPQHIIPLMPLLAKMRREMMSVESDISAAMTDIYDNYTISEWKKTHVRSLQEQIDQMWEAQKKIISQDVWPRRPLMPNDAKDDL